MAEVARCYTDSTKPCECVLAGNVERRCRWKNAERAIARAKAARAATLAAAESSANG